MTIAELKSLPVGASVFTAERGCVVEKHKAATVNNIGRAFTMYMPHAGEDRYVSFPVPNRTFRTRAEANAEARKQIQAERERLNRLEAKLK